MKKNMRRAWAWVMILCMVLSLVPAAAMPVHAADDRTVNGYYENGQWVQGGDGTVSYDVDGTPVYLSKTAKAVDGVANTYDVTLTVKTSTSSSVHTDAGAVVLVIDTSSSMKSCADCGGRDRHNSGCVSGSGSVSTAQSRLVAAKAAANEFLASYCGTDANATRMLAIVTFDGGYRINMEWNNVAGGADQNDYNSALNTINGLNYAQGTNMEGGLKLALDLLDDSDVSSIPGKNVVLLSDGAPTQRINNSSISASKANCDAAANQATGIKNTGSKLYTVCFGAVRDTAYTGGPTVSAFLRDSVASSGCAYDADNAAGLMAAFKAITESITSGLSGKGWTTTDPMAPHIDVASGTGESFYKDGAHYTWELSNVTTQVEGNTTYYIYTYTYRVTFDPQFEGFVEGKYYPTNDETYLNIDGKQYAFPVPGVKATLERKDVTVTKVWNDENDQDGIRPTEITVQLMEGDRAIGEPMVLSAANGWSYTWDGDTYNLIVKSEGKVHVYTVKEINTPKDYTASATFENSKITLTNTHEVYKTAVEVTKVWNDANNQDGARPDSITVHLWGDGVKIATAQLTKANGWKHVFDGLELNSAKGKAVVYTVTEDAVPGYTTSIDGHVVTNTHEVEKTSVPVTKVWNDANNQDGIRPTSITVKLFANGVDTGKTLTLTAATNWKGEFTNLDKYSNAKEIKYTLVETAIEGYTSVVNGNTITNTHVPAVTEVSGSKTWKDNDNQDGVRPESITVNLVRNGEIIATKTVTGPDWSWSFTNLPKFANGELIKYAVTENEVDGYSATYNGYNITNTHTPDQTSVTVTKSWQDANDQDGIRPASITVKLLADGVDTGKTLVLSEGNGWTGSFTGLDVNKAGKKITYTIEEISVEGYTTSVTGNQSSGFAVTNTHEVETVEVSGSKTWLDNNNQDGFRPTSITVKLTANGEVIATKTVTAANGWSWSFNDLPKYENKGTLIEYAVIEEAVEDYSTSYNGYDIINEHTPEQTSVTVTKSWQDNNDQDGIRANTITVKLLANGVDTGKTVTLSEGNNWTGSFTGLDKYENGEVITYTVAELNVPGYDTIVTGDQNVGYTITNVHAPETVEVKGAKTWLDNNDQDGFRPESITVYLLKNGEVIDSKTVTAADNWAWSFVNLPKYENHGTAINYSVKEEAVEDYTTVIDGYNITNTHAPEQTSVAVTKSWKDNNDQDGIRPESVTVELVANGEATGKTLVLSDGNNWTATFTDLDKYENGEVITYTVKELTVAGYEVVITGDQNVGYTVTNSHTPETVEVSGAKTWDDNNNQDGFRPASITVYLLKNGEVIDSKTVTAADNWAWSFVNLPKYENHGTAINYSVKEEAVEDYTTVIDGYNITNTHAPEQTSVAVTKSWKDNNDQDGIRPESVTVELVANGVATGKTLILSEGNNWTATFTDLDKYENGEVITYTVKELTVAGYDVVVTGNQKDGYTVTNSHNPETTKVEGTKTWLDNNDQDGFRPESITINLLADGEVIKTVTVTEADNWTWSFENLPKYRDHGTEIVYTVTEGAVDEYTSDVNGFNVTNTHAPEKTSVNVIKVWADSNNQDGIRPADITVELFANGKATGKTLILSEGNNWNATFTDLDKYEKGEIILYTVEEKAIEGYETVITGDQNVGYTVTNSHNPELIKIEGSKTWKDHNNQDGFRPESITINLLADGEVINTAEVTEESGWTWSFENLPKYRDQGVEIVYSIVEEAVEEYSASYEGFDVTNEHTPHQTSVTVTKAWADNDDQDGIRPESIKVVLLANGEKTRKTLKLSAENNWTDSFTELDKYENGVEIVYTVEEIAVEGYESVITGTQTEGYVITNSHNPETTEVAGSKTWNDANNQDGVRPEAITINLMKNGEVLQTITVTEADGWAWTFENLPKYENHGEEIVYSITENAVEGYSTVYDGFNVTNERTPDETSVTVTKSWVDGNDGDGIRPGSITIRLLADGKDTGKTLKLNAKNNWTGSFTGLAKNAEGKEIVYTVTEDAVKGYNTVIKGDMASGFVVTNTHTYIPKTGDERSPMLWMLLMLFSGGVIAATVVDQRKRYAK